MSTLNLGDKPVSFDDSQSTTGIADIFTEDCLMGGMIYFGHGSLRKRVAVKGIREPRRQGHGVGGGKLAAHADFVRVQVEENGDVTLDELCVALEGCGVTVHRSNVGRLLHRLGLSHKKRPFRPASRSAPT